MSVYRVKLFTHKKDEIHRGDRDYCLKNHLLAIGWGIENNEDISTYEERYLKKFEKEKLNTKLQSKRIKNSFKTCFIKRMKNINIGECVWTQVDKQTYLLGIVSSDLKVDENNKRIGFVRDCKWKNIDIEKVPNIVKNNFSSSGYTITKMNVDKDFEDFCKKLYFER